MSGGIGNLLGVNTVKSAKHGVVEVYHSVTFAASSAVSTQSSGTGVSFADGSTGVNVVTFDHPYVSCLGVSVTPVGSSGGQMFEVSTAWDQATKTLSMRCIGDAGSAENWAQITYLFTFKFRNTGT